MGVLKKGKRKIIVENQAYYWFVKSDSHLPTLEIMTEDKKFMARIELFHPTKLAVSKPKQFYVVIQEPIVVVTPKIVAEAIQTYLLAYKKRQQENDWHSWNI